MTLNKSVWKSRDNEFILRLESVTLDEEGRQIVAPTDMSTVTSILLELEGGVLSLTVGLNDPGAAIDWWRAGLNQGEVAFVLGDAVADVTQGNYRVRLTLFSTLTPDGVVWIGYSGGLAVTVFDT